MPKEATIEQQRSRAYNRAVRRLREAHPQVWQSLLAEEYEIEGLQYRPRLTPQQKAKKQIEELLNEFPELTFDPQLPVAV